MGAGRWVQLLRKGVFGGLLGMAVLLAAARARAQDGTPVLQVEQPAGTALASGSPVVDFGTVDLGTTASLTFVVRNTGTAALALAGISMGGSNAGDFHADAGGLPDSVAAGGQASFVVTFAPSAQAARTAVLHLASNSGGAPGTLDITLTGDGPPVLAPVFASAATVPNVFKGFTAAGLALQLPVTLGFAPSLGQALTLVSNTSTAPVIGTFTGLAEGAAATGVFNGDTLYFTLSYRGGDGNDITLTRVPGPGQAPAYAWSVLAGKQGGGGQGDGTGAAAQFALPSAVAMAPDGSLVVVDTGNNTIRRVSPGGATATLAGQAGMAGIQDGPASQARFNSPQGVAVAADGTIYVADTGSNTIRKITTNGWVSTLAGTAGQPVPDGAAGGSYYSFGYPPPVDGTGSAALFCLPTGLALDAAGNLYVGDAGNETIRKVTPAGVVTTVGSLLLPGESSSMEDVYWNWWETFGAPSPVLVQRINMLGVAVDAAGLVYVADSKKDAVRMMTPNGTVSNLSVHTSPSSVPGWQPFLECAGITRDAAGNLYVTSILSQTVARIDPTGLVTPLAGGAVTVGAADGTGAAASFDSPEGTAIGADGTLYLADTNNNTIRTVSTAGVVATLAGSPLSIGSQDGPARTAPPARPPSTTLPA